MSRLERFERRHRVLALSVEGRLKPSEIAKRVGLRAGTVREIINEARPAPRRADAPMIDGIWGLEEDQRRLEIHKRAAFGARTTLRELSDG